MPQWREDKILELANQLTYSPAAKRREQLKGAISLVADVDGGKSYPWDLVHFRITGFQLRGHADHVVAGEVLLADLATLIEFLSDTLAIKLEEAGQWGASEGDAVLLMEEVSRKFSVSVKTIQRWRKSGLLGLRFVYPDGRRRLGFLESMVGRFATENKERVEKSALFTQMSEEEKRAIINLARELAARSARGEPGAAGAGIKEIARAIGEKMKRSAEAVRYTIRRHDREHPEAAIFGEAGQPLAPPRHPPAQASLFEHLPEPPPAPVVSPAGDLRRRAEKLKREPVEFVANPLFDHPDAENIILHVLPAEAMARAEKLVAAGLDGKAKDVYLIRMPRDLPAVLQDIFRLPVMPQAMELDAFRRMNYLKRKGAGLIAALDVAAADEGPLAAIEGLLKEARDIKNQIVQSNLRVAVHVARKHQRPGRGIGELVSDANIWLMRAADTYDFARPTKFSTYASLTIMKNFARDRAEQLTRRDERMLTGQQEILAGLAREAEPVGDALDAAGLQGELASAVEELPQRERDLVRHHFGLDAQGGGEAKSLAEIGDAMGITKARVRQLEARALRRLRLLMEARRERLRSTNP